LSAGGNKFGLSKINAASPATWASKDSRITDRSRVGPGKSYTRDPARNSHAFRTERNGPAFVSIFAVSRSMRGGSTRRPHSKILIKSVARYCVMLKDDANGAARQSWVKRL
jgi:hypothetical protein